MKELVVQWPLDYLFINLTTVNPREILSSSIIASGQTRIWTSHDLAEQSGQIPHLGVASVTRANKPFDQHSDLSGLYVTLSGSAIATSNSEQDGTFEHGRRRGQRAQG
jgi:hypothetical protein